MDIATRIIKYMGLKNYKIFVGSELNIVYIEGLDTTGKLNADRANEWNDSRMVIQCGETPKILGWWQATTEPGRYYTQHPMNPKGAARIAFGQYKAWRVGTHGNSEPHEALVQVAPVKVCRDLNKDGFRTGDRTEEGTFGINQHHGYDLSEVGKASAGCLVGKSRAGHREFMRIIKKDSRYLQDVNYIFWTTVIAGDDLFKVIND